MMRSRPPVRLVDYTGRYYVSPGGVDVRLQIFGMAVHSDELGFRAHIVSLWGGAVMTEAEEELYAGYAVNRRP